jgi:hypothetical protein
MKCLDIIWQTGFTKLSLDVTENFQPVGKILRESRHAMKASGYLA